MNTMKENIEQLIEKFWAGTASVEERVNLLALLNHDHTGLKEKLEASFLKAEDPKVLQLINYSVQTALLDGIQQKLGIATVHKPAVKRWSALRIAVAAIITISVCTITWLNIENYKQKDVPQQARVATVKTVAVLNEEATAKIISLPDHSRVLLEPGAKIEYTSEFGMLTRSIHLSGTAKFNVAHNKARPFIVFANGYSTTALGTEFIVNGNNKERTTVELISGRVVVKDNMGSGMKDTFLKPGDELTIRNADGKVSLINKLMAKESNGKQTIKTKKHGSEILSTAIKFKLSPLSEVFARIEELKQVKISADGEAITNKVFTGELLADDSLETMLSMICGMNGLDYKIEQGRVTIKQK